MWKVDHQRPAGAQASAGAHGHRHRAGRDLHLGDLRPHRHAPQHLHDAVRPHLPEHRLRGAGQGRFQQQHSGRGRGTQADPGVAHHRRPQGPGRLLCRGHRHRLRPVRRARRQGRQHRRCPHHRAVLRPQPAALVAPSRPGHGTDHAARRRDGRGDGARSTTSRVGDHVRDPARRAPADLHHLGLRQVRHRRQPGGCDHRRLRPADGAAAVQRERAASTPSTSWPSRVPTRRRFNTPSPGSCLPGSRS